MIKKEILFNLKWTPIEVSNKLFLFPSLFWSPLIEFETWLK